MGKNNKKLTTEEFIEKAQNIHKKENGEPMYDYSFVEYINNHTKVIIKCEQHGIFKQIPTDHINNRCGCNKCSIEKKAKKLKDDLTKVITKANKVHNNKYDYSLIIEHKNYHTKIPIVCKTCEKIFMTTFSNHIFAKSGCPKCGTNEASSKTKLSINNIISKANKIHNNTYDYQLITEYTNNSIKVPIICKICNNIFHQSISNHTHPTKPQGCPCCSTKIRIDKSRLTIIDIISKANKIHNNIYDYSLITEYKNILTKVPIICKKCNNIFNQSIGNHTHKSHPRGCPLCAESIGERKIKEFLENKKIKFERGMIFSNCRNINPLPFDFYLLEYDICIEYDGIQHFESVEFFGGEKTFNEQVRRDKIKTDYCKNNNIKLIRIKYTENIEQVLNQQFLNVIS